MTLDRLLGCWGAKSFRVVEISDRAVAEKAQSQVFPSIAVLAHVLEHVSFPKEFLANLLQNYKTVYVEVPKGIPAITTEKRSKVRLAMGLLASLSPQTWRPFAKPSAGRNQPSQLLRMSEHLTFFEESSFARLLIEDLAGTDLISCMTLEIPSPDRTASVRVIQALFKS